MGRGCFHTLVSNIKSGTLLVIDDLVGVVSSEELALFSSVMSKVNAILSETETDPQMKGFYTALLG